jgi:hypothetical protein
LFYDAAELEHWLGEVLSLDEAQRLHAFLEYQEP